MKRYVDAFRAPLQGLTNLKAQQVHAMRACSLVAIPPSEERTPPPGGFPRDLSAMNLTSWAGLIQDVAQGMKVVPPNLSMEVYLDSMVLLQLMEATTEMGYCRICCQPSPRCLCSGAYQWIPTETWSQMMARIPGQGVVASTGGPITRGAATAEVQEPGATSPPLGLTPLDFTNWSLPLPEALLTGGLPAPLGGPSGIGRQTAGPWAPGPQAPAPPMQVPSAPQGTLLIHQQRLRQPAAPYQQVVQQLSQLAAPYQQVMQQLSQPTTSYQQGVQPPRRPAGRGAQLPSGSATPATGQPTPERRRRQVRGCGVRGRSVSHPGRGRGIATNVPSTTTPGATQPQPGHRARTRHPNPALLAAKYHSSGWRKDLEHVLKVYYRYNLQAPFMEPEWVRVRELFFDHFVAKKAEALRLKEESPLDYMPFITEEFYRATCICLHELPEFTRWIKRGSYFHGLLVERGQVQECPHLIGAELPKWPQPKPSESRQDSYTQAEGPVAGSSEPAAMPTAAPTQETPTEEPLVAEAPIPGPSHSNTPAPMETGRAEDGQS